MANKASTNKTSNRLKKSIDEIMTAWEERANDEIDASNHQKSLALKDSLPDYLLHLSNALSDTVDRTEARKKKDKEKSTRLGIKHGSDRAQSLDYTIDQLISEYQILRQVIFDVMEEGKLNPVEREVIVCSIEQAVNDAATEFSDHLKKLKEQMAQVLAHDLRNPLTTAKISSQLILKRPDDRDNCISKADLTLKSLDRIDKMITELLDASMMKAGEQPFFEFKACDLDWVAREIVNESNIANEGRINVESKGKCLGLWNENGLRRLFENLITNAVKYGQADAPITVSIKDDANSATVSVHNLGQPISNKDKANIFKKYNRSNSSKDQKGWGLGLTVVTGMVKAHHGTIKVESEKAIGTTFIVKLPKEPKKDLGKGKVKSASSSKATKVKKGKSNENGKKNDVQIKHRKTSAKMGK